jgi:DNA-binding beta-propeller fold protein YncE
VRWLGAMLVGVGAALAAGCQSAPRPIFPPVSPPLVWPPAPERARIRYVGELRGQASLGASPSGWAAMRAALAGPMPQVEFSRPAAVAVAGQRVFVADVGLGAVHLLDLDTRHYELLRGAPGDRLRVPIDLTIVGADTVAVADRGRAAVDFLGIDGRWRATKRWPELAAPVAIAWDPSRQLIWLADAAAHACLACRPQGALGRRIGRRGDAPGEFNFPRAVAAYPPAGLVVADAMNFRIQVFDDADRPVLQFGQKGDAAGDFAAPRGVAVDSDGHIYVLDNQFENVQIFDQRGRLLLAFGQGGSGLGEFALPAGITIDGQDRIWIADSLNRRVQVFQYLSEKAACAPSS